MHDTSDLSHHGRDTEQLSRELRAAWRAYQRSKLLGDRAGVARALAACHEAADGLLWARWEGGSSGEL